LGDTWAERRGEYYESKDQADKGVLFHEGPPLKNSDDSKMVSLPLSG